MSQAARENSHDIAYHVSARNDFTFECMPPQSDLPVTITIQTNLLYMIEADDTSLADNNRLTVHGFINSL